MTIYALYLYEIQLSNAEGSSSFNGELINP